MVQTRHHSDYSEQQPKPLMNRKKGAAKVGKSSQANEETVAEEKIEVDEGEMKEKGGEKEVRQENKEKEGEEEKGKEKVEQEKRKAVKAPKKQKVEIEDETGKVTGFVEMDVVSRKKKYVQTLRRWTAGVPAILVLFASLMHGMHPTPLRVYKI